MEKIIVLVAGANRSRKVIALSETSTFKGSKLLKRLLLFAFFLSEFFLEQIFLLSFQTKPKKNSLKFDLCFHCVRPKSRLFDRYLDFLDQNLLLKLLLDSRISVNRISRSISLVPRPRLSLPFSLALFSVFFLCFSSLQT